MKWPSELYYKLAGEMASGDGDVNKNGNASQWNARNV
jgi:hypothetical protein